MLKTGLDISDPLNWLLLTLAMVLLAVQVWLTVTNRTLPAPRKAIRLALNVFLWLLVVAFILDLRTPAVVSGKVLVVAENVPSARAAHLKDSLGLTEVLSPQAFEPGSADTVLLVGQDFSPAFLESISREKPAVLRWIAYHVPDRIQEIKWEGIVRKGQMQRVTGLLQSSQKQFLKLRYASETLDSVALQPGMNTFSLSFPVFAEGIVATTIELGQQNTDTISFFSRPGVKRNFEFILDSPDFETTALANWLGRNGHAVKMTSKVSRNTQANQTINKTNAADIYMTDPGHAGSPLISKALNSGKSILMIGLTDVQRDFFALNNALATHFNAVRISTDENVTLAAGITARPYRFAGSTVSFNLPDIPVAVTKSKGRVGVSLLDETFPLLLSGDSLAYSKLWTHIIACVAPPDTANISIPAPVFEGNPVRMVFNNSNSGAMPIVLTNISASPSDTLFRQNSLLNKKTSYATFMSFGAGSWQTLNGPFSGSQFFTENEASFSEVRNNQKMQRILAANGSAGMKSVKNTARQPVSDWVWLALFLSICTALWVEAKL